MKLDDYLKDVKTMAVSGHIRPDGDCIGSVLGVYNYIRKTHSDIQIIPYLEPVPGDFLFLPGVDKLKRANKFDTTNYDLFVACDCGDISRLGDSGVYFTNAVKTICIDHHETSGHFADINYVFPEASSTCELIGEIIDNDKIDRDIAECLYTGIVTDTGCFQYNSTHRSTMEFAGELMEKGIDYSFIVDHVFYERSEKQFRMLGVAINNAELFDGGKVIGSYVTLDQMKKYDAAPKNMEGVVSTLRSVSGVVVAFFMYPTENGEYKVSARGADDTVDLSKLAAEFGGGGHKRAAGFSLDGDDPKAMVSMLAEKVAPAFEEK
ncbi:MAG: bifunctional oligoribonuclease/PAP phosphatase NrnA [Lachnospiraceae bacterium]|uniref:Bifunctional oligoribonuclease/PAP phosphatase NrnA n=1 Tax=Candidatus Weimeria bifida TaxID=2599074 RepID=A0A6N7IWF6_9FIRM|nr:bifunctional oligoribonuclease/PAP phosphatase NrnA [Candidatus Weimeria bifida]RRF96031.1 MAG: bifunctional oligoribonuclease/PAP phosphatase NrnA [Lachnospiraceae bacterium]